MFGNQMRLSLVAVLAAGLLALSGCGGSSSTPPDPGPDPALGAAQKAAADAATAADAAAGAAEKAHSDQTANQAADPINYALAVDAATRARDAAAAAKAASDAAAATDDTAVAQAESSKAQTAQTAAEDARDAAERYAGMVQTAQDAIDEQNRIAGEVAKQAALARDEWRAARTALAGLAGKESANLAAYQRAKDAVDDAKDAYEAALAATTVAEAKDAVDDAKDANDMAQRQVAVVIASSEAPALKAAQMAAKSASDAAKKAYDDAKDELGKVEAFKDVDKDSYDMAAAKVADAKAASDAAKAASDAAAGTSVLADAQASQGTAEGELANATAANTDAVKYAGMVQTAEDTALSGAKAAAQNAYGEAKAAYDAAKKRVDDLTATDVADYVRAMDGLVPVKAAHDAAKSANDMAQAATTSADAKKHQSTVETQRDAAVTEKADVDMYAALVEAVQKERNDEDQREKDVASARDEAMTSYTGADGDATKAEAAADAAEKTAPGTAGAEAVREAAKAARTAADKAKAAHDAITDEMTKVEADAKAKEAADEAKTANAQYMAAKSGNDTIQTAHAINEEQQRTQAIADARSFGGAAVIKAKKDADAAQDAADAAKNASEDANAAYMQAVNARTDATEAKKQAEAAKAAHTDAQTAADAAMEAYEAAKAAIDGVMDDSTRDQANTARMTAERQAGIAATSKTTAMDEQSAAEVALAKAVDAAGSYTGESLGLLAAANHADETNAKTRATEVKKVADAIAAAAGSRTDTNNDSSDGSRTVTASWLGNTYDNPSTPTKETEVIRVLTVTLSGLGDGITSDTKGTDRSSPLDGDTADAGEGPNASIITGPTGFTHGFDISAHPSNSNTPDGRHAVIFTDKVQGKDQVYAKTIKYTNLPVMVSRLVAKPGQTLDTTSESTLNTTANYDHDGNPDTKAIVGGNNAFSVCASEAGCITSVGGVPGSTVPKGTRIFNATVNITAADAAENESHLAFGIWLQEDTDTDTAGNQPAFGAVAGGGDIVNGDITAVTGTATYRGAAMGVYTKGTAKAPGSVDYFSADATLNADFGKKGADATLGTVKGVIDNIVAGGKSTGDVITLGGTMAEATSAISDAATISSTATFSGAARMGSGKLKNSVTTYTYTGSWSGSFYNPARNAADTQDDLTKAPGSAAGTFGVTGTDEMGTKSDTTDDVTTSYVGAFGAHKE